MSREHILGGASPVYVNETGTRDEILAVVYVSETVATGSSIKTVNGLALASVKTVNGLALASVKTVNGLA